MVSGADMRVYHPGEDARWAPVFAARPDLVRLEVVSWVAEGETVYDMLLHWAGRRPVSYTTVPRGAFQDLLLDCWERVDPPAFAPLF